MEKKNEKKVALNATLEPREVILKVDYFKFLNVNDSVESRIFLFGNTNVGVVGTTGVVRNRFTTSTFVCSSKLTLDFLQNKLKYVSYTGDVLVKIYLTKDKTLVDTDNKSWMSVSKIEILNLKKVLDVGTKVEKTAVSTNKTKKATTSKREVASNKIKMCNESLEGLLGL